MKIIALLLSALGCALALETFVLGESPNLLLSLTLLGVGMWLADVAERRKHANH